MEWTLGDPNAPSPAQFVNGLCDRLASSSRHFALGPEERLRLTLSIASQISEHEYAEFAEQAP